MKSAWAFGILVALAGVLAACSQAGVNVDVQQGDTAGGDTLFPMDDVDSTDSALDQLDLIPDFVSSDVDSVTDGGLGDLPEDVGLDVVELETLVDIEDSVEVDLSDVDPDVDLVDLSDVGSDAADVEVDVSVPVESVCDGLDDNNNGEIDEGLLTLFYVDNDGDGFGDPDNVVYLCEQEPGTSTMNTDCDDNNKYAWPGYPEKCDLADNNCNGEIDEELGITICGLGQCNHAQANCVEGVKIDCDEMAGYETEVCDGEDNDCDGEADNGVKTQYFEDKDLDGFGNPAVEAWACVQPEGFILDAGDCNDDCDLCFPGGVEVCDGLDNDCSGEVDDGLGTVSCGKGECLHDEPACSGGLDVVCDPMAGRTDEVCDGLDNDCDGEVDQGVQTEFFADGDGDGFGDELVSVWACEAPAGYVANDTDCDDAAELVNPDADEDCNLVDDNCDGSTDEGLGDTVCGLGPCEHLQVNCVDGLWTDCDPFAGRVDEICNLVDDDCDGEADNGLGEYECGLGECRHLLANCLDGGPAECDPYLGMGDEVCDGKDNDCDGLADEDQGQTWCGVGACEHASSNCVDGDISICDPMEGFTNEICNGIDDDCNNAVDDNMGLVPCGLGQCEHLVEACVDAAPGYCDPLLGWGQEDCDGIDNDCDGLVDEDLGTATCGEGQCVHTIDLCKDGQWQECDSNEGAGDEICDGIDNNCDGVIDDGVQTAFFQDYDLDGFGDPNEVEWACEAPDGYVADDNDCDDSAKSVSPLGVEVCDGVDQNCNGSIDEGTLKTYYRDDDTDTHGDVNKVVLACSLPAGAVTNSTDCDDSRSDVHPGGFEICDGADQDCDGTVDDGVLKTFFRDADSDGFGATSPTVQACEAPTGYVFNSTDCDDLHFSAKPGGIEVCDGLDNDCDTLVDEGVKLPFYPDLDGDGYGVSSGSVLACAAPTGFAPYSTDCDDNNKLINPIATEICDGVDNDCDGGIDEAVKILFYRDVDGDGYGIAGTTTLACTAPTGYASLSGDCLDSNVDVHPGAPELCDGLDNNCNSQLDEGVKTTYYRDYDSDGFGNPNSSTQACVQPTGYVTNNLDCNDSKAAAYPGAIEICDSVDNDCDLLVDEDVKITFYRDADGDTYGNLNNSTVGCAAPLGYVTVAGDCNDSNININPGKAEICDNLDNNCNQQIDEGVKNTYYLDFDSDSFGSPTITLGSCTLPTGYVANNEDCDDYMASVYPGALEACDGLDNDCDGPADEDWKVDILEVGCGTVTVKNIGVNDLTEFVFQLDGNNVAATGPSLLAAGDSGVFSLTDAMGGAHTIRVNSTCCYDYDSFVLTCE